MSAMIGPIGATLITLAILCSTFGAHLGQRAGGPAGVLRDGAATGCCSRSSRRIHPRYETPANAIWALAIWAGAADADGRLRAPDHDVGVRQLDLLHDGRAVGHRAAAQAPGMGAPVPRHGLSLHGDRVRAGLVGVRRQHARGVAAKLADGAGVAAPAGRAVLFLSKR